MMKLTTQFAAYNQGAYGDGAYSTESTASTTTTNVGPLSALANTGYDILIPVFLGIALVVAGAILLIRRRLRRRQSETSYDNSNRA